MKILWMLFAAALLSACGGGNAGNADSNMNVPGASPALPASANSAASAPAVQNQFGTATFGSAKFGP
jgi:hypothetical protein